MKETAAFRILFRASSCIQPHHVSHTGIISVLGCHLQRSPNTEAWRRRRECHCGALCTISLSITFLFFLVVLIDPDPVLKAMHTDLTGAMVVAAVAMAPRSSPGWPHWFAYYAGWRVGPRCSSCLPSRVRVKDARCSTFYFSINCARGVYTNYQGLRFKSWDGCVGRLLKPYVDFVGRAWQI